MPSVCSKSRSRRRRRRKTAASWSFRMKRSPNTVAIVQARMGATRFPGKVLETIEGRPMLWQVIKRVRSSTLVERVAVATSDKSLDDPVAEFCAAEAIDCFRGSEHDVLDRYYRAAKEFAAQLI